MKVPKGRYEYLEVIMSDQEAEQFSGAIWRKPTEAELDELAHYFAEDFIRSEVDYEGLEMDKIEYLIHLNREKQDLVKELLPLTIVMDMVKMDIQIFYTFSFHISKACVTHQLSFEDGLGRTYKMNGVMGTLNFDECIHL